MRRFTLLCCTLALAAIASTATAAVRSDGIDTNVRATQLPLIPQPGQTCKVLWWHVNTANEVIRLSNLGLAITTTNNPADLNPANLANYDVLVIAYTGPGVIPFAMPVIQGFVANGGGLLIHQPNAQGLTDYAPPGFEVNVLGAFWCTGGYAGTIVNGAHPVTMGMTDADLSGDFDLVGSIGGAYTLLAVNAVCGDPALAAGTLGAGRVVFDTGNADPIAFDPGSDAYWLNIFGWLCTGQPVPTHHTTWGSLKAIYR